MKKHIHYLYKRLARLFVVSKSLSYHDTVVYVNGVMYSIGNDSYGLLLMCTRTSGWQLYDTWGNGADMKKWVLIGGEFNNDIEFNIFVNGKQVL